MLQAGKKITKKKKEKQKHTPNISWRNNQTMHFSKCAQQWWLSPEFLIQPKKEKINCKLFWNQTKNLFEHDEPWLWKKNLSKYLEIW